MRHGIRTTGYGLLLSAIRRQLGREQRELLRGRSRDAFRSTLGVDAGTWSRGRGWALWKALISLAGASDHDDRDATAVNRRVIERVLDDYAGQC